ncbi:MAG: discoidin domain-containing protein [Clostridiales bacterium]|jgi:predicted GH43/DUF377 family glycosyl hydrolase|nr:discoidin domain-containing protein [Clostridiales bacterium]
MILARKLKKIFAVLFAACLCAAAACAAPVAGTDGGGGAPVVATLAAGDGAFEYGIDLAYGRWAAASGWQSGSNLYPEKATDGDTETRWGDGNNADGWIYVDLGAREKIKKVRLKWEASHATRYLVQVGNDPSAWTTVVTVDNASAAQSEWQYQTIVFDAVTEAQFVKIQVASKSHTNYGVSIHDFEVYGPKNPTAATAVASSAARGVSFSADKATDGDAKSFFGAAFNGNMTAGAAPYIYTDDEAYLIADLGAEREIDDIKIRWGLCFARKYEVFVSAGEAARDGGGWKSVYKTEASLGEVEDLPIERQVVRYIKVELIQREVNERYKGNPDGRGGGYLADHREMKLFPWKTGYEIRSLEAWDWAAVAAVPVGRTMEFAKDAPAWTHMSNIALNPEGLVLAPVGYPTQAKGLGEADFNNKNVPGFESYATYNPAVIVDDTGVFRMIYRAELPYNLDDYHGGSGRPAYAHVSTLAYAYSADGVHFTRGGDRPVVTPNIPAARWGGTEDPRMFRVRDAAGAPTYYITFTMYDGSNVREGMVKTADFETYGDIIVFAGTATGMKSGTFVVDPQGDAVLIDDPRPGKSGKVYVCIMKDGGACFIGFTKNVESIAPSDIVRLDGDDANSIEKNGGLDSSANMERVTRDNESCVALTNIYGPDDKDIVLMYGGTRLSDGDLQYRQDGVSGGWFYGLGLARISKANPFELLHPNKRDLFEPFMYPTDTNKIDSALFVKCMFADTMIRHKDKWYFYYGAGDMYVGLATSNASFSAAASDYTASGGTVTASVLAQNRRYDGDKSDMRVRYVYEVYGVDGALLDEGGDFFDIGHFTHAADGIYSRGQSISIDIPAPQAAPYYVATYLTDMNGKLLNQKSYYAAMGGATSFGAWS